MVPDIVATIILIAMPIIGMAFAYLYYTHVARIDLKVGSAAGKEPEASGLLINASGQDASKLAEVAELTEIIAAGAQSFLWAEYNYMAVFLFVFSIILFVALGIADKSWIASALTTTAFLAGGVTSIFAGYVGMWIATFSNGRVSLMALNGYGPAFVAAFKGGCVMGFSLTSLALIVLFLLIVLFKLHYGDDVVGLYEAITGYGLGGSSIALFGRVGGGIYTKAADVGADLVGKVEEGLKEDSKENPATIADNVGDNVGDIAGMGADLFGSFAEATCACLVVASTSPTKALSGSWCGMMFPLMISAAGIFVCIITSFFATNIMVVKGEADIEPSLKRQLIISTLLMTPTLYVLSICFLPESFEIGSGANIVSVKNYYMFFCGSCGLWTGLLIGYTTEYYTSSSYAPVRGMADQCKTSAATNIIAGLAVGYQSAIIPVIAIAITIYISYKLAGMFGIGIGALGILSTLSIGLTIDAYGPIADNAGGIVEMAELGDDIREITDNLDAAGNTTAAIGKGFAISSAALVSLALFGAFTTRCNIDSVNILKPFEFAGLLVGAMLPYAFSAMTMKSVGDAAQEMVEEVRRQFKHKRTLTEEEQLVWKPDYKQCIMISTRSSLREMIAPGVLVMGTPLLVGVCFGTNCLAGLLSGSLVSSVQLALSMSNTGGAWDNTKKYIEAGKLGPEHAKHTPTHDAAVTGDTVGDPLKDTSGPALNILMKLAAVESLVFAPLFLFIKNGQGLVGYF